jgi:hypothetical protein
MIEGAPRASRTVYAVDNSEAEHMFQSAVAAKSLEVGRAVVITSGSRAVGFKSDRIVHRILKALLAAQVALSSFDGNVSQEKLGLFELTSCLMAEASTCSAQIVWSKPCQAAVRADLTITAMA